MPDGATLAIALVITLVIFLAVRPLWRRRIRAAQQQSVEDRDLAETVRKEM